MIIVLKKYSTVLLVFILVAMTMATSDLLETERSSFLGFTHEQHLGPSTLELVEQLSSVIYESALGDRRVRRYFEHYDAPFVGEPKSGAN